MSFQNAQVIPGVTNPESYHVAEFERGDARHPMSPSSLKAFGQCPQRWRNGYESPESDAKDFGSLLDCRALTPELFDDRYAMRPGVYLKKVMQCPHCKSESDALACRKCKCERVPVDVPSDWNWNATVCDEWRKARDGKQIVSQKEVAECDRAVSALFADDVIKSFFDASDKQVLVTADWHDEESGLVVPVRCLMDLVPRVGSEFAKSLGDLKTTRSAALQPFTRFVFQMGYHVQASFDLDIFTAATGEDRCNWVFILQENYPPFQTGRRLLSEDFINLGRAQYRKLLANYCWCLKNGKWPGYDDTDEAVQGWSIVAPEPFMEMQGLFAPKFACEEAPEQPQPESCDLIP
jgi:hypothetical protein